MFDFSCFLTPHTPQKRLTGDRSRSGLNATSSHPWPVLHELNECYQVGALPAEDGSGLVLYPAAGLLLSEKEAALCYAQDNIETLLHDLALEHLPRRVWLDGMAADVIPDETREEGGNAHSPGQLRTGPFAFSGPRYEGLTVEVGTLAVGTTPLPDWRIGWP